GCARLFRAWFSAGGPSGIRPGWTGELDGAAHRWPDGWRCVDDRGVRSMKRGRAGKIVATLGPASSDEAMIEKLYRARADVFRVNMRHADHDTLRELVGRTRNVERRVDRPIAILADLQGPKLRVGSFADKKVTLEVGHEFILDDNEEPGDTRRVHLPHPEILSSVQPGHRLLIDDGKLQLLALETGKGFIRCRVVAGTQISNRKGVSLP